MSDGPNRQIARQRKRILVDGQGFHRLAEGVEFCSFFRVKEQVRFDRLELGRIERSEQITDECFFHIRTFFLFQERFQRAKEIKFPERTEFDSRFPEV